MASLAAAAAQGAVVAPDLQSLVRRGAPGGEVSVIVRFTDRLDLAPFRGGSRRSRRSSLVRALRTHADRAQKPVVELLRRRGAARVSQLWAIHAVAATVPAAVVDELARQPGVESVTLDSISVASPAPAGAPAPPEWNLDAMGAPRLWSLGDTGQGVVVANMDTGVDANHPDLGTRWRGGANSWFDPHGKHPTPFDLHQSSDHGTQTMGLMVGGDAGGTAIGVAPGAQWIAVKIYDDSGRARESHIHEGFQWLLDPDGDPSTDDAPDVVDNSWQSQGTNVCDRDPVTGRPRFELDLQVLEAAQIAVVFAAGNDGLLGPSSSVSPANYASCAVGAIDDTFTIWSQSSRGPSACDGTIFPELVAPGVNVRTADFSFGGAPNSYVTISGTSAAAPHVAGAIALLIGAFPAVDVAALASVLMETAHDLGPPGADNDYGWGVIDVGAAYDLLLSRHESPVAQDDGYEVAGPASFTAVAPGVLANDTDPQGDALTAVPVTTVEHGTLDLRPDGGFTYTPTPGYDGADGFTYRPSDGVHDGNVATVRLTIHALGGCDAPPPARTSALFRKPGSAVVDQRGIGIDRSSPSGPPPRYTSMAWASIQSISLPTATKLAIPSAGSTAGGRTAS